MEDTHAFRVHDGVDDISTGRGVEEVGELQCQNGGVGGEIDLDGGGAIPAAP